MLDTKDAFDKGPVWNYILYTIAEVVEQCDRGNKFPGQDGVTEELLEELRDEMSEV